MLSSLRSRRGRGSAQVVGLVIATREGEEQETGEEGLEDMHLGDSAAGMTGRPQDLGHHVWGSGLFHKERS